MSSEIKPKKNNSWWNEKKLEWYERASQYTDFHTRLADIITRYIDYADSIIEIGCGLGYLASELDSRGYKINAYDIDKRAIDRAIKRTGRAIFHTSDCYKLLSACDTLISVFFGRITEDNNLKGLAQIARKNFIYITAEGSRQRISNTDIECFLNRNNIAFEKLDCILSFPQPLIDDKEADDFLSTYYSEEMKAIKQKSLRRANSKDYPILLENNKKISIFNIDTRRISGL